MLTKQQIQDQWSEYSFKTEITKPSKYLTAVKYTMIDSTGEMVGRISLSKTPRESEWMLTGVKSYKKGLGKILFYHAMHSVYPSYIVADEAGNSDKVLKVFQALANASYVDNQSYNELPFAHSVGSDWDINIFCRFNFW